LLVNLSCHPDRFPGKSLSIRNNSDERIYLWFSRDYSIHHLPDTSLPEAIPVNFNSVAPNAGAGVTGYDPDWESIFNQLPEGKLSVYFFDRLATNQAEWEEVKANHLILRKDTSFQELKDNNYVIYYP